MTNGWNEVNNRASNYLYDANGVLLTNPRIGRSPFIENNARVLLQPRVGLAWDPDGRALFYTTEIFRMPRRTALLSVSS
jgi:hypothetical protein